MKILVSSNALAKKLSEINFDNDSVCDVTINPDKRIVGVSTSCELSINTNKQSVKIMVECLEFKALVKQGNREWRYIKDLLSDVPDQPVILLIYKGCTSVMFQY